MFWLINPDKNYCLKVLPENTINVNCKLQTLFLPAKWSL